VGMPGWLVAAVWRISALGLPDWYAAVNLPRKVAMPEG